MVVIVGGYLLSDGAEVRIVTNDMTGGDTAGTDNTDNAEDAENAENAADDGENNDGANADAPKAN